MIYDLPEQVHKLPTTKSLTKLAAVEDWMEAEILPDNEDMTLAILIVKTPKFRWEGTLISGSVIELSEYLDACRFAWRRSSQRRKIPSHVTIDLDRPFHPAIP